MDTTKKEIQQALKLIKEKKIKEAIDLLFANSYAKEALEIMKKLTENTTYENIINQEVVALGSFKLARLQNEITEIDLQNKISTIHRKITQIIPELDMTEIPDFYFAQEKEKPQEKAQIIINNQGATIGQQNIGSKVDNSGVNFNFGKND